MIPFNTYPFYILQIRDTKILFIIFFLEDEKKKIDIKIISPLTDIYANKNDEKILSLEINNDNNITVKWFKDGIEIDTNNINKYSASHECKIITLKIKNIIENDGGKYMCKIYDDKNEIISECKLIVKENESIEEEGKAPQFHLLLKDTTVKVGEAILLCVTNTTLPEPDDVEYYKDNERIYPDGDKFFIIKDKGRYILEILKADVRDEGHYKAIGFNKNGKCISECNVKITEFDLSTSPEFTVPLIDEKCYEKDLIKFEVYLIGSPFPDVKFLKDNVFIVPNERIRIINDERLRKFSLTILDCLENDSGEYKCIATNKVGETESKCILEVQKSKIVQKQTTNALAPTFIMPLPVIRKLPEMVEVSLVCIVTGEPQPSLKWFKDLKSLEPHIETYFNNGVSTLTIRMPKTSDSGIYTCEASNPSGVAKTTGVLDIEEVSVLTNIPPKFIEPLTNVSVMEGDEIILKCQLSGKPSPFLTWYKDGLKLLMNNRMLQYVDRHGNVRLNILQARMDDAGEYTCEAQSLVNKHNTLKDFSHCKVNVNESNLTMLSASPAVMSRSNRTSKTNTPTSSKGSLAPVILRKPPSIVKIHEGNRELIEIEIEENTDSIVEWTFEGKALAESKTVRTYFDGRIAFLKFFETNKFHQGIYGFTATNAFGSISTETEIIIEPLSHDDDYVSKMPTFSVKLKNTVVKLHDNIILKCHIKGEPDINVKWLLHGKTLHSCNNITFESYDYNDESIHTIKFCDINESDIGTVTCVAINKYGECHNSCELILENGKISESNIVSNGIIESKLNIIEHLKDKTVMSGENVTLNCSIEGLPYPEFSWFKDGSELTSSSKYNFKFNDNGDTSLTINSCNINDEGTYVCTASNDFGVEITQCILTILQNDSKNETSMIINEENKTTSPKFTRTPLPTINVGEGKRIDVTVKAIGNPQPHITFLKDGKIIKSSNKIYQTRLTGNGEAILTIECPVLKSSGLFTCIAENNIGKETFDFNIIVTRSVFDSNYDKEEPPTFIKELTDTGVMADDPVELECEINGFPEPSVEWIFINDEGLTTKITTLQTTWIESRIKNKLKLSSECVNKNQQGTYQCLVTNKLGVCYSQCYLLIGTISDEFAKPPKIIKKLQDKKCLLGDDVEFEIEYEGYPYVNIVWYKNNQIIKENLKRQIQFIDNRICKLILKNIDIDDYATYSVNLTNIHGQIENVCSLKCGNIVEYVTEPNFSQDVELFSKTIIKVSPSTKKTKRQRSKSIVHLKKGIAPAFVVGLSDMSLTAGDTAAVTGKLSKDKKKKSYNRDNKYDESKEINDAIISGSQNDLNRDEDAMISHKSPKTPVRLNFDPNSATLDDVRQAILSRNKRFCRPKFFVKPKPKKILDEFKSLRLKTAISANPSATLTWDKNGTILESGNKYSIYNDGDFYYLEVHNLSIYDGGFYNCYAVNSEGFASCSSEIEIIPATEERKISYLRKRNKKFTKPNFEEGLPKEILINVNEEISLECVVSGYPIPEITWHKDGYEIVPHKNQPQIFYDGEHTTLKFSKAYPLHNGKYVCSATNAEGSVSCSTNIIVSKVPDNQLSKGIEPKFIDTTDIVRCDDGSKAILVATLEQGDDPIGYQWIHNKMVIQDSTAFKYSKDGNKLMLTISDAFPEDSGDYICLAQNTFGHDMISIELQIKESLSKICELDAKPVITPLTKKYTFKPNVVGEIMFNVVADPEPVISYLNKNKQQILASSKYEMICKGNDFILRIHNISNEDAGIYYLMAVNTVGTAVEKVTVNVASEKESIENQKLPQFTRKMKNETYFEIGEENAELVVSYQGIPEPDLQWYFNNEKIRTVDLNYKIVTHKMKSKLTMVKFDKDFVGEYLCVIKNICGEDLSKTFVNIKDLFKCMSLYETFSVIIDAIIKCLIISEWHNMFMSLLNLMLPPIINLQEKVQ